MKPEKKKIDYKKKYHRLRAAVRKLALADFVMRIGAPKLTDGIIDMHEATLARLYVLGTGVDNYVDATKTHFPDVYAKYERTRRKAKKTKRSGVS